MTRGIINLVTSCVLVGALNLAMSGCERPKEEDCKRAIANIRRIYGTENSEVAISPQAMVRSCRGSSSAESVQCFINAKSKEDLSKCESELGSMMGADPGGGAQNQPAAPATEPAPAQPQNQAN